MVLSLVGNCSSRDRQKTPAFSVALADVLFVKATVLHSVQAQALSRRSKEAVGLPKNGQPFGSLSAVLFDLGSLS